MNFPFVRIAVPTGGVDPRGINNEGRRHGTIEPDSSGEMADGDPVTATLPSRTGIAASSSLAVYVFDNPSRRSWLLKHRASCGCRFVTNPISP